MRLCWQTVASHVALRHAPGSSHQDPTSAQQWVPQILLPVHSKCQVSHLQHQIHLSASLHGILHHVVIGLYIRLGLLLGLPESQAPNEPVKCADGRSRLGGLLGLLLIWEAGGGSH